MAPFAHPRTPQLPLDVYLEILNFLDAPRGDDTCVRALVSFLEASSQTRAAALFPRLWRPHYEARYTHSVEENEKERRTETKGDWRLLYFSRRRLDRRALQLADKIRLDTKLRHERAREFTSQLSFDVWDALKIESSVPLPSSFTGEEPGAPVPEDALPRRFWATSILGTIARHQAVSIWGKIAARNRDGPIVSFEDALSSMSSVFNVSVQEISKELDNIHAECVSRLELRDVCLVQDSPSFNLQTLCLNLQEVLQELGFKLIQGPESQRVLNKFPHAFLKLGQRATQVMSLSFVFVAILRRIGIDSYPITIPNDPDEAVRVYIPPKPSSLVPEGLLIDVPDIGSVKPTHDSGWRLIREHILVILMRVVASVANSLHLEYELRTAASTWSGDATFSAFYFVTICMTTLQRDLTVYRPLASTGTHPLDLVAVSLDQLVPTLDPEPRDVLSQRINREWELTEQLQYSVRTRSGTGVTGFVGMVVEVEYKGRSLIGCVYSWTFRCDVCTGRIIDHSCADTSPCGPNQVFYDVMFINGEVHYVPHDSIKPIYPTPEIIRSLFASSASFCRYFSGFEVNEAEKRGRMKVSHELLRTFPEDDDAGSLWVQIGRVLESSDSEHEEEDTE